MVMPTRYSTFFNNPARTRPVSTLKYVYVYGPVPPPTSRSPQALFRRVNIRQVSDASTIIGIGNSVLEVFAGFVPPTTSAQIPT